MHDNIEQKGALWVWGVKTTLSTPVFMFWYQVSNSKAKGKGLIPNRWPHLEMLQINKFFLFVATNQKTSKLHQESWGRLDSRASCNNINQHGENPKTVHSATKWTAHTEQQPKLHGDVINAHKSQVIVSHKTCIFSSSLGSRGKSRSSTNAK